VAFLGSAIPSLAVQFRRLHDIDRSAWWVLLNLIPLLERSAIELNRL